MKIKKISFCVRQLVNNGGPIFPWCVNVVGLISKTTGRSWVYRNLHSHVCWDSRCYCEPKDTRLRDSDWMCCCYWPCCYGHHPLHWPHIRCSSQPCGHHILCCIKALPLEECNEASFIACCFLLMLFFFSLALWFSLGHIYLSITQPQVIYV